MIDRRLFAIAKKKTLILQVAIRCISLGLSLYIWRTLALQLSETLQGSPLELSFFGVILLALIGKLVLIRLSANLTDQASADLRVALRTKVMEKAFRLGNTSRQLPATTLAQLSGDGIEQLEMYYAHFLPQLFYCLLAALILFAYLVSLAWLPAVAMLLCVPFIPITIMLVMKIAKRILSKYWDQYTSLGTRFHESLSALSVLKAYDQDEAKQQEIAADAQKFRKATMSLLSMQLNSITIMDIFSYSGAALGIGLALIAFQQQQLTVYGVLIFILVGAEFFLPMRQLGSLFHVAMNGISSCGKIFDYLALPEKSEGSITAWQESLNSITVDKLDFTYENQQAPALQAISLNLKKGSFTAFVGKSGSGKSTFAQLLLNQLDDYQGRIQWNQTELRELSSSAVLDKGILVNTKDFLYAESIRDNLLLANPQLTDDELWHLLDQVKLSAFVGQLPEQLDTVLEENGKNLSGGQRQRLILARALAASAELYIFDEITSGVDIESEEIILETLKALAKQAIVIFVSHRLYNVLAADQIYVFKDGRIVEAGTPQELEQTSDYFNAYFTEENRQMRGAIDHEG
ncbi:ABC transporter ATP-binding protein/permease [Enterococcus hulanensis]|uniref:ABC transporter ATP-binding protein/permease n=1 Tax=Enterococcus hulanensis TaxID=2559929 RepID=A0ABU3F3I2_9ENTE|nr:ABC transporter ATP-binding protein/permease [Enterococcus hulanensis]MDT2601691.1 ABC transporter ATP-binding protein/permease [Enterococcus hulanensis]MDT2609167.1 ABC transporter ATP-binding protein/permease [Enterococcus hulanensis]MDT2616792.1 ABC transporter ATP-binding protein/permease [Enterococcus hulanensis]MDT2629497.1 ABC transporter ATP-binding protein/permease [Enterococcus hulanensis]MDT2657188.1 ABC transporter ATP-binding protein/permease [Enterococcus hulanensis]